MPVKTLAGGRKAKNLLLIFALIAGAVVLLGLADAFAQNPFGATRAPAAPPPGPEGIAGWLLQKQAEFYRMLSGTIRQAKTDGSAVWLLMGISFAYGIFHAAGPGHGKAVISSYLVANDETWRFDQDAAGEPSTTFSGHWTVKADASAPSAPNVLCQDAQATFPAIRLGTKSNAGGSSSYPGAGDPSVSVRGAVVAPGTRDYQVWYRNAAAFCQPETFNLSNGWEVAWGP